MKPRLQRRLMLALAGLAMGICLLFGLLAMGFAYAVEDAVIERLLDEEAALQQAHFQQHGRWTAPQRSFVTRHDSAATLPADVAPVLRAEPQRREITGEGGRHYHLKRLDTSGEAAGGPLLLAEVGEQLVVRPLRDGMLLGLAVSAAVVVLLALAVAALLARRLAAPLEQLASRAATATPEQLPAGWVPLAQNLADDEVGAVARHFDGLLARTRAFIAREQAFTRDASHELRTPLAVLRMAIDRVQTEPALPAEARRQLVLMDAAVGLMTLTVDTLLLLAREDLPGPAEPVPLLPLAERWVLGHAAWLDAQTLRLQLRLQPTDTLRLPAPVLQLVLASLLGNAFAHGRAGGEVVVAWQAGQLRVGNPSDALPADAGLAFVKGDHSSGFGLGLAIVHRLLAQHGGGLVVSHAEGWTWMAVHDGAPP